MKSVTDRQTDRHRFPIIGLERHWPHGNVPAVIYEMSSTEFWGKTFQIFFQRKTDRAV